MWLEQQVGWVINRAINWSQSILDGDNGRMVNPCSIAESFGWSLVGLSGISLVDIIDEESW